MGGGFYRSKDPTNSIKVLNEKPTKENPEKTSTTCTILLNSGMCIIGKEEQKNTNIHKIVHNKERHIESAASPLVCTNSIGYDTIR